MMPVPGGERQGLLPPPEAPRRVGVLSLVVIGFFWVSGGIYGNETLVESAPPLVVVVWTVIVGIFFALPNALMTAELATAFPVDGGAVVWTADACGPRIGGHNCYWVWLANLLDAAVYPQIAAKYVSQALLLGRAGEQGICFTMVVCVAVTNCMGLDWVTASQSVVFFLSLFPSLLFIAIGMPRLDWSVLGSMEGEYATKPSQAKPSHTKPSHTKPNHTTSTWQVRLGAAHLVGAVALLGLLVARLDGRRGRL